MKAVNVSSNYSRSSGHTWGSSWVRVKQWSYLGVLWGVLSYTSQFPTINMYYLYTWKEEWRGGDVSGRAEVRAARLAGPRGWGQDSMGKSIRCAKPGMATQAQHQRKETMDQGNLLASQASPHHGLLVQ